MTGSKKYRTKVVLRPEGKLGWILYLIEITLGTLAQNKTMSRPFLLGQGLFNVVSILTPRARGEGGPEKTTCGFLQVYSKGGNS